MPGTYRRLSRSPGFTLRLVGALFSAAIVILFLVDLQSRYADRISDAKQNAQSFATILADHAALTFGDVDRVLVETDGVRKDSLSGKYADPGAVKVALRQLQKSSSVLVAVGWTDAAGNVIAHSYEQAPPLGNVSGRVHFSAQRDSADDQLFISPPYRSAVSDKWLTAASRRITNADGSFAGIVVAPLDQSYFTQIYRSINKGSHGSVLLLHRNGQLLAREPELAGAVGRSYANGALISEHLPWSEVGSYETAVEGVPRVAGYQGVRGLPLVILVSFDRSDVLEPWHRHLYTFGPLVAFIVAIILFGTFVLARQANSLAAKTRDLARINARFDVTLSNMSQGVCLYDANRNLVISNSRFREIYDLPEELVRPGTPLHRTLEHYSRRGEKSDLTVEQHVEQMPTQLKQIFVQSNGRVTLIQRTPMADGGWVATHEDITERAHNEQRIAFLAKHDLLTGLANRAMFAEKLDDAAKRLHRHGSTFTILMLDLDKFKNVNDTLGHPAGDQLLVEVAQRLGSSLRDTDVLARLGGDEFAIIQENEKNQSEGAISLALKIIGIIEEPFDLNGQRVSIGTSIGIAFAPEHGVDNETLLKKADLALYAAKSGGRNDFRVFEPELTAAADMQKSTEQELREAISRNEFELHYQPVIDIKTRRVCGAEAFVRWHHPSRGLLMPDQFLPVADATGLMLPLGEWILQQSCMDAAAWPPHIKLAVNLSAVQFSRGNLFDVVLCALVESGLSPERLELEIAETSLLEKNQAAHLVTIRQLKNLGISLALDNCGIGYSSSSYLSGFPFDKIKIDRSFIQGLASRRDCAAVVASVLALARGLDIVTAAKGVENGEQFDALRDAGVDLAQGYLFGPPVPHSEFDVDAVIRSARSAA